PKNIFFTGSFPTSLAAKGAAINPPRIRPKTVSIWLTPRIKKNVTALEKVTKNSVRLTDPITYFGLLPLEIKVLVTNGPQPPPPKESKNPPAPANQPACFTF